MDYVGIDPVVGLECGDCKHVSRIPYSRLLNRVMDDTEIYCDNCERSMTHDWTTVSVVQNIIRRRMRQAVREKDKSIAM